MLDEIATKPMTMIPQMFQGAFIKNHKGIKRNLIDEIYKDIRNRSELMEALMEMYAETLSTLTEGNGEGNVTWAMTK